MRPGYLYRIGATDAVPETLEASLQLSEAVLVDIGLAMGPVIASIHEKRDQLRAQIKAEAELEGLLGIRRTRNYPPERPILPGDVRAQAEQNATELRQWLGLGLARRGPSRLEALPQRARSA